MVALFRFVGLRNLSNKPLRTLLTLTGVALGVALFVAIRIINQSTLKSFRESIEAETGRTTLSISMGEIGFPEEKLELLRKIPEIKTAAPVVESHAYFAREEGTSDTLVVLGVDLLREQAVRTYQTEDEEIIDDPLVFLNQPDSIIITHAFAHEHGLKLNSKFTLATAHGSAPFTVRGLLAPSGPAVAYGGSLAIMDIDGARATFGKEGKLDRIDLVTRPGVDLDLVARKVHELFGPGYSVDRVDAQVEMISKTVASYQFMLSFFSLLALVVGLFLIFNSISISVVERRKEIGSLRALGASRRSILVLFLFEAGLTGAAGALLGAFLGRFLATLLLKAVLQVLTTQFQIRIDITHLLFGGADICLAVAIGTATALLAAAWPAFQAGRISPLEAMRKNELDEETTSSSGFGNVTKWLPFLGVALLLYLNISSYLYLAKKFPGLLILDQISPMLGASLVAPWLVVAAIRFFQPAIGRLGGTTGLLASRNLLRNPRRTGGNITGLIVGLILVTMIASMNASFRQGLSDWFDVILKADLIVSSNGNLMANQMQPLHEDIGESLCSIPGVLVEARKCAYGIRVVKIGYGDQQITIRAVDEPAPSSHYNVFDLQDRSPIDAGPELFHSPDLVAFVSRNFVMSFNKKTGDTIDVATPYGSVKIRIVGVVVDWASPVGVIEMSRDQYKKLWRDPLVSDLAVFVKPGASPDQVRTEIDRRLGRKENLTVISAAEMRKQMLKTVDQSFSYTWVIQGVALLVAMLGLLNTILASILARTREIGLMRAIGMSKRQVTRMILSEAFLQGGFGALAAIGLGIWVSELWLKYSLSDMLGWKVGFTFPGAALLITFMLGISVALIAGLYPAKRANRLEITEAIEYE